MQEPGVATIISNYICNPINIRYLAWSAAILTFREVETKLDNQMFCKVFT